MIPLHIIAVAALVYREDKILLIRSPLRGWEFPGGQVECGEDIIQGLHREILEESGIYIKEPKLVGIYSNTASTPTRLMIDFIAQYDYGDTKTSEESLEVGWFSVSEAQTMITSSTYLYRLGKLVEFDGKIHHSNYQTQPVFQVFNEYKI